MYSKNLLCSNPSARGQLQIKNLKFERGRGGGGGFGRSVGKHCGFSAMLTVVNVKVNGGLL